MQHELTSAGSLRLRDILRAARFFGSSRIRFHSCCSQWQACKPGDLYIALVGPDGDGHDDVERAVQRGASAVVAERLLPTSVPCCVVEDTREAFGQICQQLAGRPTQNLRVASVTGTYGKTTTAFLLSAVLSAADSQVGTISSLGHYDCETMAVAASATPAPPELARSLSRMVGHGCSDAVIEVSSRALAQRHVAGLEWDAAVLTNLGRDHLDFHGNTKNYCRAKLRIFGQMKARGVAIVNVDDPVIQENLARIKAPLLTTGIDRPAELQAVRLERHAGEQTFMLTAGHESVPVRTRTAGDTYIRCCLSAAAVGLVYGLDLATIVRGLEGIENVPGRLQQIECGQDFGVYVDYARTPQTLAICLKTIRQITQGRLFCIGGATQWDDAEHRAALGRVMERDADVRIMTGNHVGHETPLQIAHAMLDGCHQPGQVHVIPSREKAIHWALDQAQPGDSVVITGKGHEQYELVKNRVTPFDDGQVARLWLRGYRPDPVTCHSTVTLPFRLGCEWN